MRPASLAVLLLPLLLAACAGVGGFGAADPDPQNSVLIEEGAGQTVLDPEQRLQGNVFPSDDL